MTHNQKYNWRSFCKDSLDQIENYQQAQAEGFKGWCIHHRREIQPDGTIVSMQELKDQNLYYGRPASELIFMRKQEHHSLHNKGMNLSEEHRQKLSEAKKGEHNPNFGKHHSEDHRQKISEALKGKHHSEERRQKNSLVHIGKHHTLETINKLSKSWKGMLYWNNGISNKRSRECPGEGWTRGYLRFK